MLYPSHSLMNAVQSALKLIQYLAHPKTGNRGQKLKKKVIASIFSEYSCYVVMDIECNTIMLQ